MLMNSTPKMADAASADEPEGTPVSVKIRERLKA